MEIFVYASYALFIGLILLAIFSIYKTIGDIKNDVFNYAKPNLNNNIKICFFLYCILISAYSTKADNFAPFNINLILFIFFISVEYIFLKKIVNCVTSKNRLLIFFIPKLIILSFLFAANIKTVQPVLMFSLIHFFLYFIIFTLKSNR